MSEPLIDIRPDHWAIVADILRRHVPDREVWAFGSRAKWNAKEYSDLDLAVIGEAPLSLSVSAALADDFAESDLPFKVDVVDWATTRGAFRDVIRRDKVVVQEVHRPAVAVLPGEWADKSLGDLIEIKHGFAFKGEFFRDEPPGDILLTPGNFDIGGGFKADKFKYYDGPVPDEFVLCEGDLIVTMTDLSKNADTLGYPAFVPSSSDSHRYLHNQRLGKVVAKDENAVDYRYLHYLMCSQEYRHEVVASATGTTVKHTSPERIKRFRFRLPPRPQQRAIAHILGTLDDKIELNRRMNEMLEAMARALFKSWFVDFDPVRAKMNLPSPPGRGAGGEGTQPSLRTNPPIPTELLDFARQLRRQATDAETLLWRLLRGRQLANVKFRRQYAFPPYILDFYCHELKVAVELDGGQHNEDAGRRRDARRDEYLAEQGIRVLRFWNNDVPGETEAVLEAIYAAVVEHSNGVPSPPPPLPEGKGSFGIPKPLADLFPARLVASELGEIPEGWGVKKLGDLLELAYGKALKADNRQHGTVPVYGSNGQVGWHHEKLVAGPGIVVGRKGNPGTVTWSPTSFFPIDTTFYVVHKEDCRSLHFLFHVLQTNDLASLGADSAVPGLNRNLAYINKQVVPPARLLEKFDQHVSVLIERIHQGNEESRTLAALRDTLLPKLISGELRVVTSQRFD